MCLFIYDILMAKQEYPTISLFSGAMGLDYGMENAGFKTRIAVEINKVAVETIKANTKDLPVINSPIQQVSTMEILKGAGLSVGEAVVVQGGPCCQSFSTAGNRGSLSDPRGALFKDFCRIVGEAQPRFFVMENVTGLLSAAIKHRPLKERGPGFPPLAPEEELGSAFKVILEELTTLNYHIIYGLLNAADYGTPQIRLRVVIIGSRDGEEISLPAPTHSKTGEKGKLKWVSLGKALRKVKSEEWSNFSENTLSHLKYIKPGQNWTSLPETLQKEALGAAFESWGGRKGFCRRLSYSSPAPSLTTAPNGRATMLCHPEENRPLSVEEYMRIQEFPVGHIFEGSTSQKYILIGNAVPLSLGEAIGKGLLKTIRKTQKRGLPADAETRKGIVQCADPELEKRLNNRKKTQLPPPKHRLNPDPKAAKEWMAQVGASIYAKNEHTKDIDVSYQKCCSPLPSHI